MNEIDQIAINFGESNLILLNFCLGFLTFGVALEIHFDDLKKIIQHPKKIIVGLFSQWILLPTLTLLLIYISNPYPSIALGLVLIAACPGGNISNYATHIAKGNTSLSITMTSIVTLMALFTTPLIFAILAKISPTTSTLLQTIALDKNTIFKTIIQLIVLPLIMGVLINYKKPIWSKKLRKPVKIISTIIFVGLIIGAILSNLKNVFDHLHHVFFLVIIHNALAYIIGYYFGRINQLSEMDCRTISMETGIQNAGLGLIVIYSFFNTSGGMLLVAAWWGIWNLISAFLVSWWWSKRKTT